MTILAQTRDPFTPFDSAKHHPVTPEPGMYGFFFMLIVVALVMWRRPRR